MSEKVSPQLEAAALIAAAIFVTDIDQESRVVTVGEVVQRAREMLDEWREQEKKADEEAEG